MNENILQEVIEYKYFLEKEISRLEKFDDICPGQTLQIRKMDNKCRFFLRDKDKSSYIGSNHEQLYELSHKRLAKDSLTNLRKNLSAANSFISKHSGTELSEIANTYPDELQEMNQDIIKTFALKTKLWQHEDYQSNNFNRDALVHDTNAGVKVRSKSETLIANALFEAKIPFRYECALKLKTQNSIIYPDFTVISLKTKTAFYWEHAGMLDNPTYTNDFCKKINSYTLEGITTGNKLIITTETLRTPLTIKTINAVIDSLLR